MRAMRSIFRKISLGRLLVLGAVCTTLSCGSMGGLSSEPSEIPSGDLRQRAEAAYQTGDLPEARRLFAQLLSTDPEDIEAQFRLGVITYRQGQFEASRTHFLEVLSRAPNHHKATYNLGVIYAAEGALKNTEKANFFFDKYLSLVPEAPQKRKIMRWKALQSSGKRTSSPPVVTGGGSSWGESESVNTDGDSGDLKQWLQQEAEQMDP